jgi:hypothetical protein
MGVVTAVISCTAIEKKQQEVLTDLVCLISSLRAPCQAWKQVIKLNIIITHSDRNTDVAYKDLQIFQLK